MSATAANGAHLLVVDDDRNLLRLLTMRLHAYGPKVISRLETADDNDDTNEESIPASHSEAATVLIPLLERDEATMQKAQAQINQWEAEDATDEKLRVE